MSTTNIVRSKFVCPLWHVEQIGKCKCITNLKSHIDCHEDVLLIYNMCLMWDNKTDSVRASYCLFAPIDYKTCKINCYEILTNFTRPELNKQMCGRLNRQGAQCISGYGSAALSDGVSYADCSKHRHWWILIYCFNCYF